MKVEKDKIVVMLDNLFRIYDNLCVQHGIFKIETVGYTYMAAAGLKECEQYMDQITLQKNQYKRCINMAYDMKKHMDGVTYGPENKPV